MRKRGAVVRDHQAVVKGQHVFQGLEQVVHEQALGMVDQGFGGTGVTGFPEFGQGDALGRGVGAVQDEQPKVMNCGVAHHLAFGVGEHRTDLAGAGLFTGRTGCSGVDEDLFGASFQDLDAVGNGKVPDFPHNRVRFAVQGVGRFSHGFDARGAEENRCALHAVVKEEQVPVKA